MYHVLILNYIDSSVADPDPRVFGPPGSGSGSISRGMGPDPAPDPGLDPSIIKQKIVRKSLISTVL